MGDAGSGHDRDSSGNALEVEGEKRESGAREPLAERPWWKPDIRQPLGLLVYNPLVVRGAIAVTLGILFLIGLEREGPVMRWALPIALLAYTVTKLWELWRRRKTDPVSPTHWVSLLAASGFAVLFFVSPEASTALLALGLAVALVLMGAANLLDAIRNRQDVESWSWLLVKGLFTLALGVTVFIFPEGMLELTFGALMMAWLASGIVALVYGLKGGHRDLAELNASEIILEWLDNREFSSEERKAVIDTLFFDGPDFQKRVTRFAALMALSVIIATLAVLQDSTAVVIGAMLIAPLMTPIMALTASIVMGWPRRGLHALVTVAAAVVGAIALAAVVATFAPVVGDALQSSQVISRTSPTLLDLLIALTAGAAGAFALSRPDVSDSLPGVAIAVALVPPLAVVGVTIAAGAWSEALGAFLLFLTNLVSIVLAASVVYIIVGFSPLYRLRQKGREIRVAIGVFAIIGLIIAIPLAVTGTSLYRQARTESLTSDAVKSWLEDAELGHTVGNVVVDGEDISIVLAVESDPPGLDGLAAIMAEEGVDAPFTITVRWLPDQLDTYRYAPSEPEPQGLLEEIEDAEGISE